MQHSRNGTSLCEVLLALCLLSATSAWGLQAATAAQHVLGRTQARRASLHRAQRELADLEALSCDSSSVNRVTTEARWRIVASRTRDGLAYTDYVTLRSTLGETTRVQRVGWCD
jgi:hypothetical protein